MSDTVLLSREGALARITLNRPASLNAVDAEMAERWREVATEVAADETIGAVILDAAGRAFCAGGDVVSMSTSGLGGGEVTAMARVITDGIAALTASAVPIVAAVQGAVAGGGLGIMLVADYIVAAPSAVFVSKYANIGLTPDLGVSTLLPAAVGQRRALQLLLHDTGLDAETAREWGLVTEVDPDPAARATAIAASWLDGATAAFGQAKRLVRAGGQRSFADSLEDEARTIGGRFDTDEARVRIDAFAAASTRRPRPEEKP
ncbi:enoyl-CoA hydratase/isomerase family protein [Microbacterium thalli]|uniref:Enoyl-CoA hydratase/isomerase family protein n=1 Tax=Microbacterium thalli TaxID=3027921 RepID=A0ABT5SEL4_9MICO|nr:enoyl-CoA hydratase/isomerase family protein [Microbacterium thalli]MDD7928668.1 enoyl-CoA hydratase/isomerase family protein [Microbacterium thalli]MDD7961255.1 enoyl-CoA hydratase/isomerase family protein [Microbacterium thalli]